MKALANHMESLTRLGTFVLAVDDGGVIRWVSERAGAFFREDVTGTPIDRCSVESDRPLVRLALRRNDGAVVPLSGDWVSWGDDADRVFVGSPAPETSSEMTAIGLTLDDYPEHDSWLNYLVKSDEAATTQADAEERIKQLKLQYAEAARNRDKMHDARKAALNMMSDLDQSRQRAEKARAELDVRSRQQMAVAQLGQLALVGSNLSTLMDEAVVRVAGILDVEYCKILELQPDGKSLRLLAGVGWKDGLVGHATVDTGLDSQAGHTLRTAGPVIVQDLHAERRFSGTSFLHDHGVISGISVTIGKSEQPFGILGAHANRQRCFTEEEARFLESVSYVIAEAVTRKRDAEDLSLYAASVDANNLELKSANKEAEKARQRAEKARERLEATQQRLMVASRHAGMAEIATGVLHNVGNVLNSVNVAAAVVVDKVRKSKVSSLAKAADLMREHGDDLGAFFTEDEKGRKLPAYLTKLAEHLADEQGSIMSELESLTKNIDHIKKIVSTQQSHAGGYGVVETASIAEVVDDALTVNATSFERYGIEMVREYADLPPIALDKQKLLQIMVNLVQNAKHAMLDGDSDDKRLTLRVATHGDDRVRIEVTDNGVGILKENLTRIFSHGFTTKKDGHGFGLHSAALAAKEMGGTLSVHSDGPGKGATFTLELPLKPAEVTV